MLHLEVQEGMKKNHEQKKEFFHLEIKNIVGILKNQKPELWNLFNTKIDKDESVRVFPLSNWTEIDIWQYIYQENIPIVPLYFSKIRPIIKEMI